MCAHAAWPTKRLPVPAILHARGRLAELPYLSQCMRSAPPNNTPQMHAFRHTPRSVTPLPRPHDHTPVEVGERAPHVVSTPSDSERVRSAVARLRAPQLAIISRSASL